MESQLTRQGLIVLFVAALVGACVADSADPADSASEEYSFPLSCQDIVDACHEVDPGYGPMHDCHETAHDVSTAEACDPVRDECVALCHAAADADAGADAAADEDGDAIAGDADALDAITFGQEDHVHDHGAGD
jgi:hypothetical protein